MRTPAREIPSSEPIPNSVWTIPVAKPRYCRGTEPMIAVWLGALKNPAPRPVSPSSTAGQSQLESGFKTRPTVKAASVTSTPIDAGTRGPIRSVKSPLTFAQAMVKTGAARKTRPMNDGDSRSTSWR